MRVDQVTCYEIFSDDGQQCYGYVIRDKRRRGNQWVAFTTLPSDITQNMPLSFHRTANLAVRAIKAYEEKLERQR